MFLKLFWLALVLTVRGDLTTAEEREVSGIFKQLWSPHCEARVLADCPTEASEELRNQIRTMFKQGFSKQEIIDKMVEEYGEEILTFNAKSTTGILLFLIPVGLLVLAAFVFFSIIRFRR